MDASSRVSPLRQRMIDDMRMRKLSEKTQGHYATSTRFGTARAGAIHSRTCTGTSGSSD